MVDEHSIECIITGLEIVLFKFDILNSDQYVSCEYFKHLESYFLGNDDVR